MDGLSAAASIVTLIQVTTVLCSVCQDYYLGVKDARKDIRSLTDELTNLSDILESLKELAESPAGSRLASTQRWTAPDGPLNACYAELEDIRKKLEPSLGAKLKWPFRQKDVAKILSTLERRKSNLELELLVDNSAVSLETNQAVSELRKTVASDQLGDQRDKILKWLCTIDPSSNHNAAREKHEPETGQWLFESARYYDWRTMPNSLLWLHGKAGCGKSVLCSTIIDHVQKFVQAEGNNAVAYFYFDFNDTEKQNAKAFISSLSSQLCRQKNHVPSSISDCYAKCLDGDHSPSRKDLDHMFFTSLAGFENIYIIADAIDECPTRNENRQALMELIQAINDWQLPALHLLVTSRKEPDIEARMLEIPIMVQIDIQTDLIDKDISRYIERKLQSSSFKKWSSSLKKEVKETLEAGADGMFRWVALHLDQLHKLLQPKLVSKALKSLPKTLDKTYDQMLMRIDDDYRAQVLTALKLLAHSARPLRVRELAEAVLIDPGENPPFDPEDRYFHPSEVLRLLPGLVTSTARDVLNYRDQFDAIDVGEVAPYADEIRFAHYSVKEYIVSARILNGPASNFHVSEWTTHSFIAQICLAYLLLLSNFEKLSDSSTGIISLYKEKPFLLYALYNWIYHMKKVDDKPWDELLHRLFSNFTCSRRESSMYEEREQMAVVKATSGYYEKELLDLDPFGRTAKGFPLRGQTTCLSCVASAGLAQAVKFLLASPTYFNEQDNLRSYALSSASYVGQSSTVQVFLDMGVNLSVQYGSKDNAISSAIVGEYLQLAWLLTRNATETNAPIEFLSEALFAASGKGCLQLAEFLIENGAQVDFLQNGLHPTALCEASGEGHIQLVELLLRNGADVNTKNNFCGTPLIAAAREGHFPIVQLLVREGADIDVTYQTQGSALTVASGGGHLQVVQLLIEKGADINAKDFTGRTAVYAASTMERLEVLELLIQKGADVNADYGPHNSALCSASYWGSLPIVELLVETGAEINAPRGEHSNALCTASRQGNFEIVKFLLEKGADINAPSGRYGNALSSGILSGHPELVVHLINQGADLHAKGPYGNARETAVYLHSKFDSDGFFIGRFKEPRCSRKQICEIIAFLEDEMKASIQSPEKRPDELTSTSMKPPAERTNLSSLPAAPLETHDNSMNTTTARILAPEASPP